MRAAAFAMLAMGFAAIPAPGQVNLARWGKAKICPTWGCGPEHVKSGAIQSATAQTGNSPGADLHLEFPIFNRAVPNRAQLQATLVYDSLFWGPVSGQWQPAAGAGWWLRTAQGHLTRIEQQDNGACGWSDGNGDDGTGGIYYYDFVLEEPDGSSIPVGEVMESTPPHGRHDVDYFWDCPTGDALPETFAAGDGKGFSVIASGACDAVTGAAYDGAGDNVTNGLSDLNGNAVTSSGGTYSDPLGVALTVTGAGTPSSPVQYGYPGPGGTTEYITLNYAQQLVQLDFGCYTNYFGYLNLPTTLVYPDGATYTFAYDPEGRLASVTLPSGGTFSYVHSMEPVSCPAGTFSTFLGQWDPTMSHEWQWSHSPSPNQTIQTDPNGNVTIFNFDSSGNLTEEDDWSGPDGAGGTLLRSSTVAASGFTRTTTTELYGATNLFQQHVETQDSFGMLTASSDSDWYPAGASPIPVLRQVANTYTAAGNGEALASSVTEDGAGVVAAQTTYANIVNGNPQTAKQYANASTPLTTSFTFNSNGTVATKTEANGAVTTYGYTGGCGLFPTSITDAVGTSTLSWDCNGGLPTQWKDYNGQPTSISYDSRWRTSTVTDAASNVTSFSYPSASDPTPFTQSEEWMIFNGDASTSDVLTVLDAMGRPELQQTRQAPKDNPSLPGYNQFDTVETCYDELSRPIFVSAPYTQAAGQTESCTANPGTSTQYDALSRPTLITDADGGTQGFNYVLNDTEVTIGPAPSGENAKAKQEEFDGLGRLASVCEETAGTSAWPGGSCGQKNAKTGYWTTYSFSGISGSSGLSQMTVVQNAQAAAGAVRKYVQDWLGRMTYESNPENGTTYYSYDTAGAPCSLSSKGDLVMRQDNAGNTTCYARDSAHRLTEASYPAGPNSANTPPKYFAYGATNPQTVAGFSAANGIGRMVEASTGSAKTTDAVFTYTALGQVAETWQLAPATSGAYNGVSATYFANGAAATLSAPGVPVITYGLDGEGRWTTVGATGQPPATAASYSAFGLTSLTLGSKDSDNYQWDSAGRMTRYQITVGAATDTGTVGWNANGTLDSLSTVDNIPGESDGGLNCNYAHDDLGRILEANCHSVYDEKFAWDPFGNHNSSNTPSGLVTSFTFSNNQISEASYDGDGNLLQDPLLGGANNQFDAEGRPVSLWGTAAVYDALGREAQAGSNQVLYAPDGGTLGLMSGTSPVHIDVPLPGGGAAVYNAGGLAYYRHADGLGSGIVSSTPSQTLLSTTHLTPFGFDETGAGANYRSFTGARQDTDSIHTGGQYDFLYREYNPEQGRWWTPDPAGIAAADLTNPQSLNRYGYAGGAPLENVDPEGLDFEIIQCNPDDWNENPHCDPWGWMWGGEELLVPLGGGGDGGGGGVAWGADGFQAPAKSNPPNQVKPPGASGGGFGAKPLSTWGKVALVVACLAGLPPEDAKPIGVEQPPGDSKDNPPGTASGQGPPVGPARTGKPVPFGGPRDVPERTAGGTAAAAGAFQCIVNVFTAWPKERR